MDRERVWREQKTLKKRRTGGKGGVRNDNSMQVVGDLEDPGLGNHEFMSLSGQPRGQMDALGSSRCDMDTSLKRGGRHRRLWER